VLGQSSEKSSVAAFHASESIRSSLYPNQQPQGILQTSSVCVGCGPYSPENLPGPLCSSRKAFSACLSASLLFQRSHLMALDCSSFRRDSIIAFSTIIFYCGQRVTKCASCGLIWRSWYIPNSARHCMAAADACPGFSTDICAAFNVPTTFKILTCSRLLRGPRSRLLRPSGFPRVSFLAVVTRTAIICTIACSALHSPAI